VDKKKKKRIWQTFYRVTVAVRIPFVLGLGGFEKGGGIPPEKFGRIRKKRYKGKKIGIKSRKGRFIWVGL